MRSSCWDYCYGLLSTVIAIYRLQTPVHWELDWDQLGRVILIQMKLHMFKGLHEWTLSNNSSQYHPQFGTSSSWGHCRAEGWEDIMTLPTVRKSSAKDKELITLQLFLWSLMQQTDFWSVRKIYALPIYLHSICWHFWK